ncbi:MAG: hypothetical protein O3C40_34805 [Planctomycetota bacterium]|nr:hypothetical protein [Planctomycetota bacterium]
MRAHMVALAEDGVVIDPRGSSDGNSASRIDGTGDQERIDDEGHLTNRLSKAAIASIDRNKGQLFSL